MKFKKIYNKIITSICIILAYFMYSISVYGISNLDYKEFTPVNIQKIMNGGNIEINFNENKEYQINVNMNTKGLDKGYYTAYLYENQERDWSNYEAMSFYITNDSDKPIKINMNIKRSDGKVVSLPDKGRIVVKKDNSEMLEKIQPSFGTIELPKDFKGTIYMPFNSFREKDIDASGDSNGITQISSWGIIATLAENEEEKFSLSNFQLINKGTSTGVYINSDISIQGENIVEIPVAGETISEYKTKENNKNVKYKLIDNIDGVSISEEGRLTIKPDAEAQNIKICAVLDNSISEIIEIQLIKSWTLSAKEVDGTSKSIPKPEELRSILSESDRYSLSNNFLILIRMIGVILVAAFAVLYWWWNRDKNNKLV